MHNGEDRVGSESTSVIVLYYYERHKKDRKCNELNGGDTVE